MTKYYFITKKYKETLLLIGLSLFGCTPKATAQIIDIENQRLITDTTGWAGTLGLSIAASKNVTSYFTLRSNAHLQYKTSKNAWLGSVPPEEVPKSNYQMRNGLTFRF